MQIVIKGEKCARKLHSRLLEVRGEVSGYLLLTFWLGCKNNNLKYDG